MQVVVQVDVLDNAKVYIIENHMELEEQMFLA
jgi:hypothetical protein